MNSKSTARAENPAEQAKLLKGQPASQQEQAAGTDVTYNVSLGTKDGYFVLNWSVSPPVLGRWDWVGVFKSEDDAKTNPDGTYLRGGWQWADDGNSYQSSVAVNDGYVIAYIVWNYDTGKYQAVAISNPYG